MEADEVIGEVLSGIDVVRKGIPILAAESPVAAGVGLTLLYEGLVTVRSLRKTPDSMRTTLRKQTTAAIQELVALKMGQAT